MEVLYSFRIWFWHMCVKNVLGASQKLKVSWSLDVACVLDSMQGFITLYSRDNCSDGGTNGSKHAGS